MGEVDSSQMRYATVCYTYADLFSFILLNLNLVFAVSHVWCCNKSVTAQQL